MYQKIIKKVVICFAILLVVSVNEATSKNIKDSEKTKFSATVYTTQGNPVAIEDFHMNGKHYYNAIHKEKQVKLKFEDIKLITFLKPGNYKYDVEVVFNDGSKDTYILKPAGNINANTRFAFITMSHSKVSKIEFGPLPEPKPRVDKELLKFDRVQLKNGDDLSGKIKTEILRLKAPYATINFNTADISHIKFDGRGVNRDVVILRIGDVLTGAVEAESIKLLTRSGKEMNISSEQIRRIIFKRKPYHR
jgi:hypothetical protein